MRILLIAASSALLLAATAACRSFQDAGYPTEARVATPAETAQLAADMLDEQAQHSLAIGKVKFKGPVYMVPGNGNTITDNTRADQRVDASTAAGLQSSHLVAGGVAVVGLLALAWYLGRHGKAR